MDDLNRNVELMTLHSVSMPISVSFFFLFSNVFILRTLRPFLCTEFVMISPVAALSLTHHIAGIKTHSIVYLSRGIFFSLFIVPGAILHFHHSPSETKICFTQKKNN